MSNQTAEKIYNIGNIDNADFGGKRIPKILSTALPFIPDFFIGRDDALQSVHDQLFAGENLLLLVNGEGGIGKTAFAAKYWQRYEDNYRHLAWVFTGNSLLDALLTLAPQLHISFPDTLPSTERLKQMLTVMAALDKPCLLVLDNANNIDELGDYYQALHGCANFHLLLTTRITRFEQAPTFPIPPLAAAVALQVFNQHYPGHLASDDALFYALYQAVGGNTLVLEVLAKNLAAINTDQVDYPLTDLLHDLQQKGLFQLQQENIQLAGKRGQLGFVDTQPSEVLAALYDEVEMIKPLTEQEKRLLSNFAVLPAENISFEQLKILLAPDNVREFSKTLTDLAKRGWLEKSSSANVVSDYKISPVVQEITRHKNQPQLLEHVRTLLDTLNEKLDHDSGGSGHLLNVSYEEAAVYARYAEALVGHVVGANGDLATICDRIGNYYQTTGNLQQALRLFDVEAQLIEVLYTACPQNVAFKNGLAISYSKLGDTLIALGNLLQALRFFEHCIQLEDELYADYPQNAEYKNDLAISYEKLGQTHTALGNLDQALRFFERSTQLEEELCADYPQNEEFKNVLAVSYSRLGEMHTTLVDFQQALQFFEQYNHLENELCDAYPQNVAFKNGLAISCQFLGQTHIALGNLDQALTFFEQYNQLENELYTAYPQNVEFKNLLAISYSKLGETHTALGNLDQALTFFEQCNQLEKELYDAYPQNLEFKNGLAISYSQLGRFYRDQTGDSAQAKQQLEKCYQLWQELASDYPAYVEFGNNLAWANNALDSL